MMLSILIPTYNRVEFLTKNLELLADIIGRGGFNDDITVIISDNCSPDDTSEQVTEFKNQGKLNIDLYRQSENIGLKANALFVLEKSTSDYVMYLGDDDFISYEYLTESMAILKADPLASFIIPNFVNVTVENKVMHDSRDPIGPTQKFEAGTHTLLKCAWKGHQMSGLIFKRQGLFEDYHKYKVDNIYPYVFFAGMSCLSGRSYQIKDNPVRVTQPIKKKDWGYGDDGLVNEFFDNYKRLPISAFLRFKLEASMIYIQNWRIMMYWSLGYKPFLKAAFKIGFAKNASPLFTLFFPFLLLMIKIKRKIEA